MYINLKAFNDYNQSKMSLYYTYLVSNGFLDVLELVFMPWGKNRRTKKNNEKGRNN